MTNEKKRLEYLRQELRAERISYGELAELQELAEYIADDDVELREAAGLPEHEEEEKNEIQTIRDILAVLIELKKSKNKYIRRHAAGIIAAYHAEIDKIEIRK